MPINLSDLEAKLRIRLHDIVTGGADTAESYAAKDKFITWCRPGMPFSPEDFDFINKTGTGATAEEETKYLKQAWNFAKLVDFVPDAKGWTDDAKYGKAYTTDQTNLSYMYEQTLKAARVVNDTPSPEVKGLIEKARNLLWSKKTTKDPFAEAMGQTANAEVTEPSYIMKMYSEKQKEFLSAAQFYNSKRIAALAASGAEGKALVMDWRFNEQFYRMAMDSAWDAWGAAGFRNRVDQLNAFIAQETGRSTYIWIQELQKAVNGAKQTDPLGGQFCYTSLIPGSLTGENAGWTKESFSHTHSEYKSTTTTKSWKAGGGGLFGVLNIGGSGSGSSQNTNIDINIDTFSMSFEIAQAIIVRPWFQPAFFKHRGWKLFPGTGWHFDDMPSNGNWDNPSGVLIGYPSIALFIKNLQISSKEFVKEIRKHRNQVGGGGGLSWGPFHLGGDYKRGTETAEAKFDETDSSITVNGLQLIGFVNHLIPKSPNPADGLEDSDFIPQENII